jgi:hypothetical protein
VQNKWDTITYNPLVLAEQKGARKRHQRGLKRAVVVSEPRVVVVGGCFGANLPAEVTCPAARGRVDRKLCWVGYSRS